MWFLRLDKPGHKFFWPQILFSTKIKTTHPGVLTNISTLDLRAKLWLQWLVSVLRLKIAILTTYTNSSLVSKVLGIKILSDVDQYSISYYLTTRKRIFRIEIFFMSKTEKIWQKSSFKKTMFPSFPQFLMKSPKNMKKIALDFKKTQLHFFDLSQKSQFEDFDPLKANFT